MSTKTRRYQCPACGLRVGTLDGRLNTHGRFSPGGLATCAGSGTRPKTRRTP